MADVARTFTEAEVNAEAVRLLDGPAICYVDCETTGLDPDFHAIWEIAIIRREADGVEQEWVVQLPLTPADMARAEPEALQVGHFDERRWPDYRLTDRQTAAQAVADWTRDAILVGQNVGFDAAFLRRLLLLLPGEQPPWHYRPVCVTTLAAGALAGYGQPQDVPWSSAQIAAAIGVDVGGFEKHTALGDARLARAIWDAVMAT